MKVWEEFEELITNIQKEVTPDAVVRRDHRVIGRSGRRRQLDITITKKVGLYQTCIVIECKHYQRVVGIEKVEAFAAKLQDVSNALGPVQGVMISAKGFDAGAKAQAKQLAITLQTYHQAVEADWHRITGTESWPLFLIPQTVQATIVATTAEALKIEIHPETALLNVDRQITCLSKEIFDHVLEDLRVKVPIGYFAVTASEGLEGRFIDIDGKLHSITEVEIQGQNKTLQYTFNLILNSGVILEDVIQGKQVYQKFVTAGVDWAKIINSQQGQELSIEEYDAMVQNDNQSISVKLSNLKPFIRLVVTKQD